MADQDELYRLNVLYGNSPYIDPGLNPFSQFPTPTLQQIGNRSTGSQISVDQSEPLESRAGEEFWKHVSNQPRRNKPSVWRRIGVALAGLDPRTTPEWQEWAIDPQYHREMQDWRTRLDPLQSAMTQERLGNRDILTADRYAQSYDIQNRRLAETERHNRATEAINEQRKQGAKIWEQEDGNLFLVYPDGRVIDTQIKSSQVPWDKKLGWEIERRSAAQIEQIRAQGEEARKTRQTPERTESVVTNITPPSQRDVDAAKISKAQELWNKYDLVQEWLLVDPQKNLIQIQPVGTRTKSGAILDEEMADFIYKYIFEDQPLPPRITQRLSSTTRQQGSVPPVQPATPLPSAPPPTRDINLPPTNVPPPATAPPPNQPQRTAPPNPGEPLGTVRPNDGFIRVYEPATNRYGWVSPQQLQREPQRFIARS